MDGIDRGVIELAMLNACAGGNALDFPGLEHRAMTEAVAMLERTRNHNRDYLHVPMRMRWKSSASEHAIIVQDTEAAEPHMFGVVVAPERECMIRVEPTM